MWDVSKKVNIHYPMDHSEGSSHTGQDAKTLAPLAWLLEIHVEYQYNYEICWNIMEYYRLVQGLYIYIYIYLLYIYKYIHTQSYTHNVFLNTQWLLCRILIFCQAPKLDIQTLNEIPWVARFVAGGKRLCFWPQSYVTTRFMLCFSAWQCAFMCIFLHTCHADRRVVWGLEVGWGGGSGGGGLGGWGGLNSVLSPSSCCIFVSTRSRCYAL